MASGLYIDRDGYEDFYLDLDDVDEAAKDEWEFVRKHQKYIEVKDGSRLQLCSKSYLCH